MTTLPTLYNNSVARTALALAAILLAHVLLHMRYYIYYVDDAWFVSETYFFMQTGRIEDVLFRAVDAPDRVLLFGKTYFHVYGAFLNAFGWTKGNAIALSGIFMWLSAGMWWLIGRALGYSAHFSRTVALSVLILPVFFNAAALTRPDAFVFFLCSVTFWLFLKRLYFLSGLLLLVSVESHLMGSTAGFCILAYVLATWRQFLAAGWKMLAFRLVSFLLGMAAGACYFYWLHPDFTFERLFTILSIKREMNGVSFGFIVKYFTQHFWYRHVWELPFIIGAGYLFVKNKLWKQDVFVPVFFGVMVLSSFAMSRPNANYMVFVYPGFLLLAVYTFEKLGLLKKAAHIAAVLLLVLYGAHFIVNRSFDFNRVNAETRAALPQDGLPVIGMPDNWFAAMDRPFFPIYHSVTYIPELGIREFYLVRNDYIGHKSKNYQPFLAWCNEQYEVVPIKQVPAFKGHVAEVFHCKLKITGE